MTSKVKLKLGISATVKARNRQVCPKQTVEFLSTWIHFHSLTCCHLSAGKFSVDPSRTGNDLPVGVNFWKYWQLEAG